MDGRRFCTLEKEDADAEKGSLHKKKPENTIVANCQVPRREIKPAFHTARNEYSVVMRCLDTLRLAQRAILIPTSVDLLEYSELVMLSDVLRVRREVFPNRYSASQLS